MAIRAPGSDPLERLQRRLTGPAQGPGPARVPDRAPADGLREAAGLAAWVLAVSVVAATGLVAAAVAAAALALTTVALGVGWALVALAGLGVGVAATGTWAVGHGSARAWAGSAPYRAALARWGRWGAGQVPVVSRRAVHAVAVLSRWTARTVPLWAGAGARAGAALVRRTAVAAVVAGGALGRAGRLRLVSVGRRTVTVRAAVLTLALVALGIWPARVAVSVASAAAAARTASLRLPPLTQGSPVFDAGGRVIGEFHADDNRQPVKLSAVSPAMLHAVVDTEDVRFWSHGGVDLRAILRAVRADVGAGAARQGASTIAEQLVKNVLLSGHPDDLRTKVQEAVLANRLEGRIGKRGVLREYLNTVYFGEGAYGVQAAAETYFGITASKLDAAQAALLAGLIQDPNGYDPLRHPGAAAARRRTVLGLMAAAHHLGRPQAAAAAAAALPASVHLPPSAHGWYLDAVQQELLADDRLGPTRAARYHALYYGGLRIHTALDPATEAAATRAVAGGIPPSGLHLSAALVSVDPSTGAVPAVVGGPDYASSQFDTAVASPGRQTGSAFKTFTLVAAFEAGYSPNDVIDGSAPCRIPNPGGTPDPWVLDNYESENFGAIDLTTATANSVNCAFGRLAVMVGPARIAAAARQLGITAHLAVVPSMTLGTNDVPPLQMAAAYAALADDGVYHRPHLVTEVDGPGGRPRLRNGGPGVQAVSPQVAREVTSVLQQVVVRGTGKAAALPGRPVAGKTGTTEQYQDAWFVGFTPQLSTAVWMGDLAGEVPMTDVGGISVAGGTYPARIWNDFMAAALQGRAAGSFTPPDPGRVPGGVYLGQSGSRSGARPAGPSGPGPGGSPPAPGTGPGSSTLTTTWCWSSCGR